MDETLCATSLADKRAGLIVASQLGEQYPGLDAQHLVARYLQGIYKKLNDEFSGLVHLLPNERMFRAALLKALFSEQGFTLSNDSLFELQDAFNQQRMQAFDFFPNVKALLNILRADYQLVVITNGPVFSQRPKLEAVEMHKWVDHIVVGGEEPEEKPAASIFHKALDLVNCTADQVIHVGDSLTADVAGANAAGIQSVWVNPKPLHTTLEVVPNFCLSCVTELPDLLLTLRK
nr:HAD family hydrolase [Salinivibrio kushneri]